MVDKTGLLQGNKFTIVLRNVEESQETVEKALLMLKENGFINYFGQQRFGTDSNIKTSDIGLALIKEKWQEAIGIVYLLNKNLPLVKVF